MFDRTTADSIWYQEFEHPGDYSERKTLLRQRVFQIMSYLDCVHLSGVMSGVNQASKRSEEDFDYLVFLVDH